MPATTIRSACVTGILILSLTVVECIALAKGIDGAVMKIYIGAVCFIGGKYFGNKKGFSDVNRTIKKQ